MCLSLTLVSLSKAFPIIWNRYGYDIIIWILADVCDESTFNFYHKDVCNAYFFSVTENWKKLCAVRSEKLISRWRKNTKKMLQVIIVEEGFAVSRRWIMVSRVMKPLKFIVCSIHMSYTGREGRKRAHFFLIFYKDTKGNDLG